MATSVGQDNTRRRALGSIDDILFPETPVFARAVRAIITGDAAALRGELVAAPELVRARSVSAHHATLLHYVSANGIESELQRPVVNADEIAALLIAAGAEGDAGGGAHGWSGPPGRLASSAPPHRARGARRAAP